MVKNIIFLVFGPQLVVLRGYSCRLRTVWDPGVCIELAACCDIAPAQNVILRVFSLALGQAVHTQKMCVHMSSYAGAKDQTWGSCMHSIYPRPFELLPQPDPVVF